MARARPALETREGLACDRSGDAWVEWLID
jgi:hypothetical protein